MPFSHDGRQLVQMIMPQYLTERIFILAWWWLLLVAMSAQFVLGGKPKKKADMATNLLVVLPYLIVFGCYAVRSQFGAYPARAPLQFFGLVLMASGVSGYIISIMFLGKNWAVSAVLKQDHCLVAAGPYRWIRHPMYSFMIVFILGSGLLVSNFLIMIYVPAIAGIYWQRAKREEVLLEQGLPGFADYKKRTRMFVPGVY
jgi:protein-S-isoprenylcysteine O-methyltransferase Ste14